MMRQAHRISRKSGLTAALLAGVLGCVGMPGAQAGMLHSKDLPSRGNLSFGQQWSQGSRGFPGLAG